MKIRSDLNKWIKYIPAQSAESISVSQNSAIEQICKLDAGESVYGPSPLVIKRLSQFRGFQFYPDSEYALLRNELSKYTNVKKEKIFISNGADEIIDLLLRLVLNVGDEVISCSPTFGMYSVYTALNRGIVTTIKRRKDFSINTDLLIKSINIKTKIVFICSPNNPTGNITPVSEIEKVLKTGIIVCVDEAYFEFGGATSIPLLKKYKNLVIIRTFSKWAGIAGLRLGYGIMSEYFVEQLMKIKSPYNVNYAAVLAGIASLQDVDYRNSILNVINQERQKMEEEIIKMGSYLVARSQGNFVFIQTTKYRLERIKEECIKQKVVLKFYKTEDLGCAIRITIGRKRQNIKIVMILKKCI